MKKKIIVALLLYAFAGHTSTFADLFVEERVDFDLESLDAIEQSVPCVMPALPELTGAYKIFFREVVALMVDNINQTFNELEAEGQGDQAFDFLAYLDKQFASTETLHNNIQDYINTHFDQLDESGELLVGLFFSFIALEDALYAKSNQEIIAKFFLSKTITEAKEALVPYVAFIQDLPQHFELLLEQRDSVALSFYLPLDIADDPALDNSLDATKKRVDAILTSLIDQARDHMIKTVFQLVALNQVRDTELFPGDATYLQCIQEGVQKFESGYQRSLVDLIKQGRGLGKDDLLYVNLFFARVLPLAIMEFYKENRDFMASLVQASSPLEALGLAEVFISALYDTKDGYVNYLGTEAISNQLTE